jgi:hypothetical protein
VGAPITASAVLDGSGITVVKNGPGTVVIGGYQREPYLRLDDHGVWQNQHSPAVYLDQAQTIDQLPPTADAKAKPEWVRLNEGRTATWHDHRIHWMSASLPTVAKADPSHTHVIEDWTIPIVIDGKPGAIRGTLTYVPTSKAGQILAWSLVGLILAIVGFGIWASLPARRRAVSRRRGVK